MGFNAAKVSISQIRNKKTRKELTKYNSMTRNNILPDMNRNVTDMVRQDMKTTTQRDMNERLGGGLTTRLAKALLLLLLFLAGGMVNGAWAFIS